MWQITLRSKIMPFPAPEIKAVRIKKFENTNNYWFPVQSLSVSDDSTENASWQLRISIAPNRGNALQAINALETMEQFNANLHPELKIYTPSLTNDLSEWDGTLRGSDRDQRGKEICIYMECIKHGVKPGYYDGDYPSLPYLKKLMLDIWKVLQDAGVEMAYVAPNVTERSIKVTDGSMTPFMYTSFKPYKQRHGLLHERGYNPTNKKDPLEGLEISTRDLAQNGIKAITPEQVQARITYQRAHYDEVLRNKLDELKDPSFFVPDEKYINLVQQLNSILDSDVLDPDAIEGFKQFMKGFSDRFVSFFFAEITNVDFFGMCYSALESGQLTQEQKLEALQLLKQNIDNEKALSIQEMSGILVTFGLDISPEVLNHLFDQNPAQFQKTYQSLVLLTHEKEAIQTDVDYLNNLNHKANPGFFRKHWKAITASALTGLAIGAGLGIAMGVFAVIPTGGLSILATPLAILILGLPSLLIGGLSGLLGSLAVDWYDLYQGSKKGQYEESTNLAHDANNESYHQLANQLGMIDALKINPDNFSTLPVQGTSASFFESAPHQLASSITLGNNSESDNDNDLTP